MKEAFLSRWTGGAQLWERCEQLFLKVAESPEFLHFLKHYSGVSKGAESLRTGPWSRDRETFALTLMHLISEAVGEGWRETSHLATRSYFQFCEGVLNLALYHWYGLSDRNFQWRTLVHWYELEGVGLPLGDAHGSSWALSFSEMGIRLGEDTSEHVPHRHPVSLSCRLWEPLSTDAQKLARVRQCITQTSLLVEEWEHLNSILAWEFNEKRKAIEKIPEFQNDHNTTAVVLKLTTTREFLAAWCLHAFTDFQSWTVKNLREEPHPDIKAELEALDTLLLSGVQKILLPASVSRQMYGETVLRHFLKWTETRQLGHPDCLALQLMAECLLLALDGKKAPLEWPKAFGLRNFEWRMGFDPSSALKAFSWAYGTQAHQFFAGCLLVAWARKVQPLDSGLLGTIYSLLQSQETFPRSPESHPEQVQPAALSALQKELPLAFAQVRNDANSASFLKALKSHFAPSTSEV